jgi:hypothetical protein
MPIGIFVDLFAIVKDIHRTLTMWVFKHMTDDLCSSLMDGGWDSKITIGADIMKCIVKRASLVFKYHIAISTLYVQFFYNRERMLSPTIWEAFDQNETMEMVSIDCEMGEWRQTLYLDSSWTLHDVRPGLSYWASGGLRAGVTGGRVGMPAHHTGRELGILDIFSEYSLKIPRIYSNMLEYTRIYLIFLCRAGTEVLWARRGGQAGGRVHRQPCVRHEILIYFEAGMEFQIQIVDGQKTMKVNQRNERKMSVHFYKPPKKLFLITRSYMN